MPTKNSKPDIRLALTVPQLRISKDLQVIQQSDFCEPCARRFNIARASDSPFFETSLCEGCAKKLIAKVQNRKQSLSNTRYSVIARSDRAPESKSKSKLKTK